MRKFWPHTCGIVAVSLVSLAIVGPIAVVGVKQVDVFVVVTGQELWKDQTGQTDHSKTFFSVACDL